MTKILVIEDASDLRNDVLEMLTLEGFEAVGAEDGVEGVARAREVHPDLIVCDIMMPELDGYGVLKTLRSDLKTRTIPFIFLTAKTDRFDMRHGMVLGADDYLTKPFLVNELLESIHSQLRKREELNALAEERLEKLRQNIVTALPHELRTPLNTVIGFSEMLMTECQRLKPDQIADWAQHINSAALRLYRLVENYLFYVRVEAMSRSEEDRSSMRLLTTEHPEETIQLYAMHKAQQIQRDSDLTFELVETDSVYGTDKNIGKIIEELVDNAFKFVDDPKPVHVHSEIKDNHYVISVKDKGRGMKPEEVNSIGAYMQFDRWFYEQQGSGLGLVIIQRLVELHEGKFQIESTPGEGTTVSVSLRLVEA